MASDHERYYRWRRRETLGQLTFWGELWVDPKTLPEYEYWLALGKQRGHGFEQDSAKYYMTRTLLDEVLFAAGGVEAELLRLRRTTATAQEWTDQALREHPRSEMKLNGGRACESTPAGSGYLVVVFRRRESVGRRSRGLPGCGSGGAWWPRGCRGGDYFTRHDNPEATRRRLIHNLEALGYDVQLTPVA